LVQYITSGEPSQTLENDESCIVHNFDITQKNFTFSDNQNSIDQNDEIGNMR
jgi:hypothetical protein